MSNLGTECRTTADSHPQHDTTNTVEADAVSTPLRAASMELAAPVVPVVPVVPVTPPVPTTRSLRMLLGVLKHNPVGAIREVGVLLMMYASSMEVAKASTTPATAAVAAAVSASASAQIPSALPSGKSCGGKGGKGYQPQTKQREESARLKRRTEEAEAVLAIALATEKARSSSSFAAGGATVPPTTATNNKTRFHHELRQPAKVEDRLQGWAATRGREVFGLRELLGLSAGGGLVVRPRHADVELVRDRVTRIPAGKVRKVRHRALV